MHPLGCILPIRVSGAPSHRSKRPNRTLSKQRAPCKRSPRPTSATHPDVPAQFVSETAAGGAWTGWIRSAKHWRNKRLVLLAGHWVCRWVKCQGVKAIVNSMRFVGWFWTSVLRMGCPVEEYLLAGNTNFESSRISWERGPQESA